jgi:ABC-type transporter MlaC component
VIPILLAFLVSAAPVPTSRPGPATDPVVTVREAEKQVRAAFRAGGRRADLERVGAAFFDYEELGRRSIGSARWIALPQADRTAFVQALRALVEETWLSGLLRPDPLYAFAVTGKTVEGAEAVVRALVQSGGSQAPVELRLFRGKDGRWRIYDLSANGVSILAGYREQLPPTLDLGGIQGLLASLRAQRAALAGMRSGNP